MNSTNCINDLNGTMKKVIGLFHILPSILDIIFKFFLCCTSTKVIRFASSLWLLHHAFDHIDIVIESFSLWLTSLLGFALIICLVLSIILVVSRFHWHYRVLANLLILKFLCYRFLTFYFDLSSFE